ncbi:Haloacid dehalogenase-like hydrolase-domain-containing protein [Mrakia frigida]|uniref:Haloacid dehalogenase-like hydrolase-domain-containing protein n=1 Tax=Mrakia frigida TaxID=29902 RepID=UPI003FCBF0CD
MAGYVDLSASLSTRTPKIDGPDTRAVVWLDIDNTLYPKSSKIHLLMQQKIHAYFLSLGLSEEKASVLHKKYYSEYGLAIRGLVKHHEIDALDYDRVCDASLPLEEILSYNPELRKLLQDIDPSKARILGLTNAYKTHGLRVLNIIGVSDLIEALVYCDYGRPDNDFGCKPEAGFFNEATAFAFPSHPPDTPLPTQYFVDDSLLNITASLDLGFKSVHFKEKGEWDTDHGRVNNLPVKGKEGLVVTTVDDLEALREVWSEIFFDGSERK